jgi:hypothetical protein
MTKPEQDDKRHPYGPRALGAVLPDVMRPAFRKRSPAVAHLASDWPAVIGPALAAVTAPRRLFQGTLVIAASGPIALELQHLSVQLLERINTHLGRLAVTRLRFTQDFAASAPPPAAAPPPRPAREAASRAVSALPEGPLRDALERLGQAVLARHPPA